MKINPFVILAATYHPRGEMTRLERILPQLRAAYAEMIVVVPPHTPPDVVECLREWFGAGLVVSQDWAHGRHLALAHALDFAGEFVHYADMDRLIRWVETRPEEWARAIAEIPRHECLIFGRTEAAWETHPRALRDTERVTSHVFSAILGQELDLSAGSKGFSRAAAEWIVRNSRPERALGKDSEWVILAHRGGFRVSQMLVDGLDWEIPDRHQDRAADGDRVARVREEYDANVESWRMRVGVAREIAEAGVEALKRDLPVRSEAR
ncbi:MAG TPA: hypothetical protein PK530_17280 [Anaerolineales bacterium]|nr:hypothetical protein [Anaerolineales bacterium]